MNLDAGAGNLGLDGADDADGQVVGLREGLAALANASVLDASIQGPTSANEGSADGAL